MIPDPFAVIALLLWLRYVHVCVKHREERRIRTIAASEREEVRRRRFLRQKSEGGVFFGRECIWEAKGKMEVYA